MELTVLEAHSSVAHVKLDGRMDPHGSHQIRAGLRGATVEAKGSAVVDLSGVTFITSVGIGMLVDCSETMRRAGRRLIMVGASGNVDNVLKKTGIYNIITSASTVEDAITLAAG